VLFVGLFYKCSTIVVAAANSEKLQKSTSPNNFKDKFLLFLGKRE
jgi:hypothetical protein